MTKSEFLAGYSLLTIQPWGKLYRGNGPEATIQAELYYRNVNRANPIVWQAVCEAVATGDHWPNLGDLKASLNANGGYRQDEYDELDWDGPRWEESPEPLAAVFAYTKANNCTVQEATIAVLSVWVKQNQTHEDYSRASDLLDKAKRNYGMPKQPGNVRVSL